MNKYENIIGYTWENKGTICILIYYDEYDGLKCYIGHIKGRDIREDLMSTLDWGSTFDIKAAEILINSHGTWIYKEGINWKNSIKEDVLNFPLKIKLKSKAKLFKDYTDEELLRYAIKNYTLGKVFVSKDDENAKRIIDYWHHEIKEINWIIQHNNKYLRIVRSKSGLTTCDGLYCSNPHIYSDLNGWAEIIN